MRIAGEVVHPIHHYLIAGRDAGLDEVERVLSHPQATAQCARFLARAPAPRRAGGRHVHRRGGAPGRATAASPGLPSARAWRPSCTGRGPGRAGGGPSGQPDPVRMAGAAPGSGPTARGPAQDIGRVLGLQRRVARRAGVGPARARPTAGSTSRRSNRGHGGCAWALHVLRRPGGRATSGRGRGAGGPLRAGGDAAQCWAPTPPPGRQPRRADGCGATLARPWRSTAQAGTGRGGLVASQPH